MTKIIGIIGLGSISKRHINNIKNLYPGYKIALLSSRNFSKENYDNVSTLDIFCKDINELIILNPHYVLISCPSTQHADYAKSLIESGIPTIIEKPISSNYEDAKLIRELALKYNAKVQIGYCLRYLDSTLYIKDILLDQIKNDLLSINVKCGSYLPDWRDTKWQDSVSANNFLGGGALLELSHEIDLLISLFKNIDLVWSQIGSLNHLNIDVEEEVAAVFLTNKKKPITMNLNFCQKVTERKITFNTRESIIDWDILQNKITITTPIKKETIFSGNAMSHDNKYIDMIKEFHENDNIDYSSNIDDAVKTLQIIDQIKNIGKI